MGGLDIQLASTMLDETRDISVVVSVLDDQFEVVRGPDAISIESGANYQLPSGTYVVDVETQAGDTLRRIANVKRQGRAATVSFGLHELSGHETLERTALLKGVTPREDDEGLDAPTYESAWMKLWWRSPDKPWLVAPFEPAESWTFRDGVRHVFSLPRAQHIIQVGGPDVAWRQVAIPAHDRVTVTVLPDRRRPGEIVISAMVDNDLAESLLGFLVSGKIDHAKRVVARAEHLLFEKYEDPIAAAVGGYYLLRVGKLDRLRSWAHNLSRAFAWLPDGAVIHAWQLIHTGRREHDETALTDARKQLLLAASRGTPVYTEGLRLLVDGLTLFDDANDTQVRTALEGVTSYADAVDWNSTTVLFRGVDPDRPGPKRRVGMPLSTAGMVFLNRVNLGGLLRMQAVKPETAVRFEQQGDEPNADVEGVVTSSGSLKVATGKLYRDPSSAAEQVGVDPESWYGWHSWSTEAGESLGSIKDSARSHSVKATGSDPIERLGLSTRTTNALRNHGFDRTDQVTASLPSLTELPGIGERSVLEIARSLTASRIALPTGWMTAGP